MDRPRLWLALALITLGACVSLEEMHIPKGGVRRDQRELVAVFGGPGPVMSQEENKAEALGSITPGLSFIMQGAQNDRDLAASKDLQQYLPTFGVGKEFYDVLMKELPKAGHPGKLLSPEDAEITADQMEKFNKASDILEWKLRYFVQNPETPVPRNYETLLQLNDALVLEVDVAYGLVSDDQQNASPNAACVVKLFRVDGMHLLWRHEDYVEDKAGARLIYEFKQEPDDLIKKYRKLLPQLAAKVVEDYRKELTTAGLYSPYRPPVNVAASTAAPSGWYAAPDLPTLSNPMSKFMHPPAVTTPAPPAAAPGPAIPTLPGMSVSTTSAQVPPAAVPSAPAQVSVPPLLMAPAPYAAPPSTTTTRSP